MSKKEIGVIITDTHMHDQNADFVFDIFMQAKDYCANNGHKVLYFAGDWFTSRKGQSIKCLVVTQKIIDSFADAGITIMAIPGNHDKADQEIKESFLTIFRTDNFIVIEDEQDAIERFQEVEGVSIYMLGYFKENGSYMQRLSTIAEKTKKGKNILITHIATNGARNNDGTVVESNIDSRPFKKFNSVFVGHYHNRNSVDNHIHYIGSAYQANFGEDTNKGLTVFYDDCSFDQVPLVFPEFVKYKVNVEDLTPEIIAEIQEYKQKENCNFRVVITGQEHKIKSFDKTILTDIGVECKTETIESIKEIESAQNGEMVVFTPDSIIVYFKDFCKENKLDYQQGLKLLKDSIDV